MKGILKKFAVTIISGLLLISGVYTAYSNSNAMNGSIDRSIDKLTAAAYKADKSKTSDIDDSYDIFFMDDDAYFKHKLDDGVYWVPVNFLGKPQYTGDEVREIIDTRDPEYIEKKINTLYDAISYRYLSGFTTTRVGDHKDLPYNGIIWQHHKNGKEAILTNEGDCSGNAVLISYLLQGNYDESGFISYNLSNGGGHVFNYILHDGCYYFLDCTDIRSAIIEDSRIGRRPYFGVNLIMADSVEKFIKYYSKNYLSDTAVFQMYQDDRVAPIGYKKGVFYLPDDLDIKFYGDVKKIRYVLTKRPTVIPSWENDTKKEIDRSIKGEIAVIPYSHSDYGGMAGYHELRLYNLNGILVELQHITINCYNHKGKLQSKIEYNTDDLDEFMLNNIIFDMAAIGIGNLNNYARIDGSIEYTDINGNLVKKDFDIDLAADDIIPVKYVQ
jgi:hypothetical protein